MREEYSSNIGLMTSSKELRGTIWSENSTVSKWRNKERERERRTILREDGYKSGLGRDWGQSLYWVKRLTSKKTWLLDQRNDLVIMQSSKMNLPKCDVALQVSSLSWWEDPLFIEHEQGRGDQLSLSSGDMRIPLSEQRYGGMR